MVLDDEMEQAALKIQSTFRGHKSRQEIKTNKQEEGDGGETSSDSKNDDTAANIDEDIANMVLDDEMAEAALKIQSTFRGHKSRKELKDKQNEDTETEGESSNKEEKEEEEEKKEEETQESSASSNAEEKTAQQLQEEEDIANLVMDEEMEKTALKIQSAFRGKFARKKPKDASESYESSAGDKSDYDGENEEETSPPNSDENPNDMYEYFGISQEYTNDEKGNSNDDVDYSNYTANRQSYSDEIRYSIERYDIMDRYNETIYPDESEDDIDLMQGGGIFPDPSMSGTLELLSSGRVIDGDDEDDDNNNNNRDR
jgi:hypothetical protein